MRWKKIKNYKGYYINELGLVYSAKTDRFLKPDARANNVLYISLTNKSINKSFMLSTLVLDYFQPSQTETKRFAWHEDLELLNVNNDNLTRCTRSDRMRMFNEMKGKKRGVYAYTGVGKNRYRAMLKNREGKVITVGYYKTEFFARFKYIQAYQKMYGRFPY